MIFIIDAYNVLHFRYERVDDTARNTLIASVKRYAKITAHQCILVFDGGTHMLVSQAFAPQKISPKEPFQIIYTGHTMTADTYIIEYLERMRPKNCAVVSFDRAIVDVAEQYGCAAFEPPVFLGVLADSIPAKCTQKQKTALKKYDSHFDDAELDRYMHEYADRMMRKDAIDDETPDRLRPSHTPSKAERAVQKIYKKATTKK